MPSKLPSVSHLWINKSFNCHCLARALSHIEELEEDNIIQFNPSTSLKLSKTMLWEFIDAEFQQEEHENEEKQDISEKWLIK